MLSFKKDAFNAKIVSHTYTNIGKVIFDKPITRIGERAFEHCTSLTSVTIPDSVTTIGEGAFAGCKSLKEFKGKFAADGGRCLIKGNTIIAYAEASGTTYTIPDSVTTIGYGAFEHCTSLTSVNIPDSVTTIGDGAFRYCYSLTSVNIPDSVTTIGEAAFWYCDSLTSVNISNSVITIGKSAFSSCRSLKEFKGKFAADGGRCLIIDGVLNAFAIGCGVTQYTIPDSVTTIGKAAFSHCKSLTSVTIGNSVTTIGNLAFCWCSGLASVTIPDSVTTIGKYAFCDCSNLTRVTIGRGVSEIGKEAFKSCYIETVVCYPKIPPKINDSFDRFENLIVPTGCEEAYANSDWGKYLE